MKNFQSLIKELDQVSKERQLSRYDQLLLDAAEVQLLLDNLGTASNLIHGITDYYIVRTFERFTEEEEEE